MSESFSEQLRRAIDASGMTRYAICKSAGFDKGTMSKFMSGQVGMSLDSINRLWAVLDLRIETPKRPRKK